MTLNLSYFSWIPWNSCSSTTPTSVCSSSSITTCLYWNRRSTRRKVSNGHLSTLEWTCKLALILSRRWVFWLRYDLAFHLENVKQSNVMNHYFLSSPWVSYPFWRNSVCSQKQPTRLSSPCCTRTTWANPRTSASPNHRKVPNMRPTLSCTTMLALLCTMSMAGCSRTRILSTKL